MAALHAAVRQTVPRLREDRRMDRDQAAVLAILRDDVRVPLRADLA
jgi:histidine ammonia-lyase